MHIEWTNMWVIAAEIAVALIFFVSVFFYLRGRRHRTEGLRTRFGPEYGRGDYGAWIEEQGRGEARGSRNEGGRTEDPSARGHGARALYRGLAGGAIALSGSSEGSGDGGR